MEGVRKRPKCRGCSGWIPLNACGRWRGGLGWSRCSSSEPVTPPVATMCQRTAVATGRRGAGRPPGRVTRARGQAATRAMARNRRRARRMERARHLDRKRPGRAEPPRAAAAAPATRRSSPSIPAAEEARLVTGRPSRSRIRKGRRSATAPRSRRAATTCGRPIPLAGRIRWSSRYTATTAIRERRKSDWEHLLDLEAFILVTPQEPHQEVDGGQADNGWDNYPNQTRTFLYAILDDVGARYDVDIDRVYATGASAGSWVGGQIFFTMQDTWAAVQFSCGGASGVGYQEPSDAVCLTPARFEIAPSDFLYGAAQTTATFVADRGHEVEFHDTKCEGHCCGQREDYGDAAWAFFEARTHCGAVSRSGCGAIPTP